MTITTEFIEENLEGKPIDTWEYFLLKLKFYYDKQFERSSEKPLWTVEQRRICKFKTQR